MARDKVVTEFIADLDDRFTPKYTKMLAEIAKGNPRLRSMFKNVLGSKQDRDSQFREQETHIQRLNQIADRYSTKIEQRALAQNKNLQALKTRQHRQLEQAELEHQKRINKIKDEYEFKKARTAQRTMSGEMTPAGAMKSFSMLQANEEKKIAEELARWKRQTAYFKAEHKAQTEAFTSEMKRRADIKRQWETRQTAITKQELARQRELQREASLRVKELKRQEAEATRQIQLGIAREVQRENLRLMSENARQTLSRAREYVKQMANVMGVSTSHASLVPTTVKAKLQYDEARVAKARASMLLAIEKNLTQGLVSEAVAREQKKAVVIRASGVISARRDLAKRQIDVAKAQARQEAQLAKQATASKGLFGSSAEQTEHFKSFMMMQAGAPGFAAFSLARMGPQLAAVALTIGAVSKAISSTAKVLSDANKVAMDFSKRMSDIRAVIIPTVGELAKIEQSTKLLGKTTVFTAREVAEAYYELGKLGFTADQLTKSGQGIVDLAAASDVSIVEAGATAAKVMRQYGMGAQEMNNIVDTMAFAFARSALDLGKFTNTMEYAGPIAAAVGISLEETTAAMAIMANRGIDAQKAGTALRNMFLELGDSSSKASKLLASAGVTIEDDIVTKLRALKSFDLGPGGYKQLFTKWSASGVTTLMASLGEFESFLEDLHTKAEGSAQQMAETRLDNLQGSLTYMKSALEGFQIELGETLQAPIRVLVDNLTKLFYDLSTYIRDHKANIEATFHSIAHAIQNIGRNATMVMTQLEPLLSVFQKITGIAFGDTKKRETLIELPSITSAEDVRKWRTDMDKRIELVPSKIQQYASASEKALTGPLTELNRLAKKVNKEYSADSDFGKAIAGALQTSGSFDALKGNLLDLKKSFDGVENIIDELVSRVDKASTLPQKAFGGPIPGFIKTAQDVFMGGLSSGLYKLFDEKEMSAIWKDFEDNADKAWEQSRSEFEGYLNSQYTVTNRALKQLQEKYSAEDSEVTRASILAQKGVYQSLLNEWKALAKEYGVAVSDTYEEFSNVGMGSATLDDIPATAKEKKAPFKVRHKAFYEELIRNTQRDTESALLVLLELQEQKGPVRDIIKEFDVIAKDRVKFTASYNKVADSFKGLLLDATHKLGDAGKDAVKKLTDEDALFFSELKNKEDAYEKYGKLLVDKQVIDKTTWDAYYTNQIKANEEQFIKQETLLAQAVEKSNYIREIAEKELETQRLSDKYLIMQSQYFGRIGAPDIARQSYDKEMAERLDAEKQKLLAIHGSTVYKEDGSIIIEETVKYHEEVARLEDWYNKLGRLKSREVIAEKINIMREWLSDVQTLFSAAHDIQQIYHDIEIQRINDRYDLESQRLSDLTMARLISARTEATLQKDNEEKKARALKEAGERSKNWARATVVLDTASAIMGTWAGYAKFGMIGAGLAGAQTAMLAGLGIAKLAQIDAQKFATGGFPKGRNAVIQVNEYGQESVLNARATATLGRAGVNALNSGTHPWVQPQKAPTATIVYSPSHTFNTAQDRGSIVDALRQDREEFAEFMRDSRRRGYAL